jgi:uncharacterized protein (TIGR03435 family)
MRAIYITLLFVAVPLATPAVGQPESFAAASIKTNRSGFPGGLMDFRAGGAFVATNETLQQFLRAAYDVDVYRIVGGPDWVSTARFDIQATAGVDLPIERSRQLLRALLVERFKLRSRTERREMPTYDLTVARGNGVPGPRLRVALPSNCVDRGPMPGRVAQGELPSCGLLPAGIDRMSGRRVALARLVSQLSSITGRVVTDRTGLTGMFDIDLEWAPSEAVLAAVAALRPGDGPPRVDPDRPSLLTALEEQLGLRLQSTRGMVDVLVIEGAERPVDD